MKPLLHRLVRTGTLALAGATLLLTTADALRPVHAAGMVVNTLTDAVPPATDGLCSLREAMTNANANAATHPDCPAGAGADTITFSVSGTISPVETLPDIADPAGVVIDGAGKAVTIRGGGRLFWVGGSGIAELRQLTLKQGGGDFGPPCFMTSWGAPAGGGAVCNLGELTVADSTFDQNWATERHGGAIASQGETHIIRSVFKGNYASTALGGHGGAIFGGNPLSIRDSTFAGNFVQGFGTGGAIRVYGGQLSIDRSAFVGNSAPAAGGAIWGSNTGLIDISQSTFSGNSSGTGGAISGIAILSVDSSTFIGNSAYGCAGAIDAQSFSTITNSTFSGNVAGEHSGAIAPAGTLIVNSTITGNVAGVSGGGLLNTPSGGSATLRNTILAGNSAPAGPDCAGPSRLEGPNLLGTLSGCASTGTPPLIGAPLLAALADNGGPTKTHALLPGSPALNAGDPAVCASSPIGGVDQRGVPRAHASCDLGAYEASRTGGRNLNVTASLGQVTLGWDSGTDQTGYALLTYNTASAAATLTSLPAHTLTHTHAGATNGVLYCYVLAATGPSGVLGLSDLECALPGSQSGTVIAGDFTLSLHSTTNASLIWQAPTGGAESYLLVRIPLDGTPPTNVPFTGAATASTQPLPAAGACFQLVAYQGAAHGGTNVLCGVPGVTTLGARVLPTLSSYWPTKRYHSPQSQATCGQCSSPSLRLRRAV